nr:MAG TPA: hypothetical protein [Caudoviricetes sp.]
MHGCFAVIQFHRREQITNFLKSTIRLSQLQ